MLTMPSALVCQRTSGFKDCNLDINSNMETLMIDSSILKMPAVKSPAFDKSKFVQYVVLC